MFIHIFTYRLKCLLRHKQLIFWTLLFPFILATLFNLAFGKLEESVIFNPINIAVVENDSYNKNEDFKQIINQVSQGEDRIFNLTETSIEEAEGLLREDEITAYIILDPDIHMIVRETGLNQNIVKIFLEEYQQTVSAATKILATPTQNMDKVISDLSNRLEYIKEISLNAAKPNVILNYFYALLAMACFYGSFWGHKEIVDIQANISDRAARVNLAPVHKLKFFLYSSSASVLILFVELLIFVGYLRFALGIDFGNKTGYVLFTVFVGSIVGITFGAFISSLLKKREGLKIAIIIGVSMLCAFLSGMMYDRMKYIIAQKVPILSYLNPENLLTDAFYCLYYYDTFQRYWLNIGILGIFILAFCFGTYMILRRQKYASI